MSQSKFIPTLQAGNGYTYLKLKGILDEDNLLVNLLSQIQGRLLLIDMAEIERINSCGVRDWVNWLNQIQALGISVILLRCSPVVVSQANMVTNFAADAFIHSFYAPYVHPDTGDEQSVLLFTEDIRQNQPIHAPKIFNEAGDELEFDEFEESYFAFISDPRIMNYKIPDDIQAVIQYFIPEAATRQPVIASPQSMSSSPVMPVQQQAPQRPTMGPQSGAFNNAMYNQRPGGYGIPNAGMPQTNPYAGTRQSNPYNAVPNTGIPNSNIPQASPYGGMNKQNIAVNPQFAPQPASPVKMPQPAAPVRHEQPPIPSSSDYQVAPGGLRPAPMPQAAPAPMQPAPAPQPPAPMPIDSAPKPAPQPVSQLARQSMARSMPVQKVESPAEPVKDDAGFGGSYNPDTFQADRDKKMKRILLFGAIGFIVLLAIVLVIILAVKK
ncbi:MAG: hypothetical protein IJU23_13815 [Proteobacteria bacterium]|nr:hypothetical protein [Pseudomonadota bacterium]